MDTKTVMEAAGFIPKAKEVLDKLTHKDEVRKLESELEDKDNRLEATTAALGTLGLSSQELAIISIALVAVVAIVAIVVVKSQPAVGLG